MLTVADVASWLQLSNGGAGDPHLAGIVAATNSFVDALPDIPRSTAEDGSLVWAPDTKLAATMLAARLHRRRNSPSGVEALTEGGATYVSRYDPDVGRILRIDGYRRPAVG